MLLQLGQPWVLQTVTFQQPCTCTHMFVPNNDTIWLVQVSSMIRFGIFPSASKAGRARAGVNRARATQYKIGNNKTNT